MTHYLDREMTAPELNMENRWLRIRMEEMQTMLYEVEKELVPLDRGWLVHGLLMHLEETFKIANASAPDLIARFIERSKK